MMAMISNYMSGMRNNTTFFAFILMLLVWIMMGECDQGKYLFEVSSRDIMENISKGNDITYHDAVIVGDLDLNLANLSTTSQNTRVVHSSINIMDSRIEGTVRFSNSKFMEPVRFEYTDFVKNVDFTRSEFTGDATFGNIHFLDQAHFDDCDFKKNAIFSSSNFMNNAYFRWCQFEQGGHFFDTAFEHNANFVNSTFSGSAEFTHSHFEAPAYFWFNIFGDSAEFSNSQFADDTYFEASQFEGPVRFVNAQFDGHTYFGDSSFKKLVSFDYAQMMKEIYFDGAIFYRTSTLSLNRAKISKLYLRWNTISDRLSYDDEVYLFMIGNYKNLGWHDDSTNCYYDYRIRHPMNPLKDPIQYIYDRTSLISYGYGVKPVQPLISSLLIILISGIIFYFSNGIKRSQNLSIAGQKISIWESIHYSATAFTSGASAFISYPSEIIPVGKSRYLVTLERFLGWIFFTLFLVSLANTAINSF